MGYKIQPMLVNEQHLALTLLAAKKNQISDAINWKLGILTATTPLA